LEHIVGKFTLGGLTKQMATCLFCPNVFEVKNKPGIKRMYCSERCRRQADLARKKKRYSQPKSCSYCKQIFPFRAYNLYCSLKCKNEAHKKRKQKTPSISQCFICKAEVLGCYGHPRKYCSKACKHKGMFGGKPPLEERTRKAQRNFRERNMPGLTRHEISVLRFQWISQGQGCAYCDQACETVDHIVPLNRGGDNQKQNLTPACRSCNSSKGDRLLSEWKLYDRRKAKKTNRAKTLVG